MSAVNIPWKKYREIPGNITHVKPQLVGAVNKLDGLVKGAIMVHCLWEERTTGGYHPMGLAIDFHIEHSHPLDQYFFVERTGLFVGLGIYGIDMWRHPGLHADLREDRSARWAFKSGEGGKRKEVALDKGYVSYLLNIMP